MIVKLFKVIKKGIKIMITKLVKLFEGHPYWGLTFIAVENNSSVSLNKTGTPNEVSLVYSLDNGVTWIDYIIGTVINLNKNDKISFRATNANNGFSSGPQNYYNFVMTGKITSRGNINSLLVNDEELANNIQLTDYCYHLLFYNCKSLITAPQLPSTALARGCYQYMFMDCSSLTTAPELPATTLATGCYYGMFKGCTSLTTAPELSATILTLTCYKMMFSGCTSLTTAPELSATTLAMMCYDSMFSGCTSLTTAPELSATTLANSCYERMFQNCTSLTTAPKLYVITLDEGCCNYMFEGCTNLNYIEVSFTDWTYNDKYISAQWVVGVSSTGTFKCPTTLGTNESITRGINYCPVGWEVINID